MKIHMYIVAFTCMSFYGSIFAGPDSFDFDQLLKLKETARASQDLKTSGAITLSGQFFKSVHTSGATDLSRVYIEGDMRTSGSVRLEQVRIDGSLRASGSLKATKTSIGGGLHSSGSVNFEDVAVSGPAKLSGKLNATSSGFSGIRTSGRVNLIGCDVSGELSAASTRVVLENTSLGSIRIRERSVFVPVSMIGSFFNWFFGLFGYESESKPQVILKGSTVVLGDVIFEEEGTLVLEDQARVQGKIQGAKVKKR